MRGLGQQLLLLQSLPERHISLKAASPTKTARKNRTVMLSLSQVAHRVHRKIELFLTGSRLLLPLLGQSRLQTSLWRVEKTSATAAQDRSPCMPTLLTQGVFSREMIDWCSCQGKQSSCDHCYATGCLGPGSGFSALGDSCLTTEAAAGLFTAAL